MESLVYTDSFKDKVVYFDTNLFIYAVEEPKSITSFSEIITKLFTLAYSGEMKVITSEITLAEVLVGAYKQDAKLVSIYDELLKHEVYFSVYPVDKSVLRTAAFTRTIIKIALADAIHVSTAIIEKADFFITNDVKLKVPEGRIQKVMINEIAIS